MSVPLGRKLAGRARRDRVVGQDRDGPVTAGSYKVTPTTGRAKRSPARSTDHLQDNPEVSALRRVRPGGRTSPIQHPCPSRSVASGSSRFPSLPCAAALARSSEPSVNTEGSDIDTVGGVAPGMRNPELSQRHLRFRRCRSRVRQASHMAARLGGRPRPELLGTGSRPVVRAALGEEPPPRHGYGQNAQKTPPCRVVQHLPTQHEREHRAPPDTPTHFSLVDEHDRMPVGLAGKASNVGVQQQQGDALPEQKPEDNVLRSTHGARVMPSTGAHG
jgi:hypothetical protein